jgi:hypothetical protein
VSEESKQVQGSSPEDGKGEALALVVAGETEFFVF